jgi:hypothetical protein
MSTANLDSADLKKVEAGGLIREDVMEKIWDISSIPLPFTDRIGGGTAEQEYTEWTQDKLQAQDLNNKMIDGQDIDQNNTNSGKRLGNHCQISGKEVRVSTRANASDSIGNAGTLAYQVMMRQRELRRDVEGILQTGQGSVEDDGDTIPGECAGIFAFIKTNGLHGVGGSTPGFDDTTKLVGDVVPGTKRGLTEKMVRDVGQMVYEAGGNPSVFMARPAVVRLFSEYCFTSSARIATLTSETGQSESASTAKGAVNVFVTDFGVTLDLVPNRLQPAVAAGTSNIGIYDFEYIDHPKLVGYQTQPLAKTGLSEKRMMTVDYTLRALNEEALGAIYDIDETVPVTAGV